MKIYEQIKDIKDTNGNSYFSKDWLKANILKDTSFEKYAKRIKVISKLLDNNE